MTPFRFGDTPRQLFGIEHAPSDGTDRRQAAVLCNPFGQEAIRCHRMLRVLAERLARSGFHVLRFDYFATGDSDGDDAEGNLAHWVEDIVRARAEVVRRSGHERVSLFGLRVGGTLAALASARASFERLVLWDPVFDGAAYLAEVKRQHAFEAEDEQEVIEPPPPGGAGQLLGFPCDEGLERSLAGLSIDAFTRLQARSVALLHGGDARAVEPLRAALARDARPVREQALAARVVWASDDAMNSAYVPTEALKAIVEMFEEER